MELQLARANSNYQNKGVYHMRPTSVLPGIPLKRRSINHAWIFLEQNWEHSQKDIQIIMKNFETKLQTSIQNQHIKPQKLDPKFDVRIKKKRQVLLKMKFENKSKKIIK